MDMAAPGGWGAQPSQFARLSARAASTLALCRLLFAAFIVLVVRAKLPPLHSQAELNRIEGERISELAPAESSGHARTDKRTTWLASQALA